MTLLRRITLLLLASSCIWVGLLLFVPCAHQEALFFFSAEELHFMDYFMPRSILSMPHPYSDCWVSDFIGAVPRGGQCYPALAVFLAGCFPENIAGAFSCQFVGTIFYLMGTILVLKKYGVRPFLPCAIILVSAPYLFTVEVGNLILYAAGLSMIFIAWYDSPRLNCRAAASVALAIASVLKITPILLGFLYLRPGRTRDWRGAIFSGCLFIALLIVPFAFLGGYTAFMAWIDNAVMNSVQWEYVTRNVFGVYGLVSELLRVFGYQYEVLPVIHSPVRLISSALGVVMVVCALTRRNHEFVQLSLLVIGMLFIPSTMMCYTMLYVLPLLIVGVARCQGRIANSFGICLVACCMPLQIPILMGYANFCFSSSAMIDLSFVLLAIACGRMRNELSIGR